MREKSDVISENQIHEYKKSAIYFLLKKIIDWIGALIGLIIFSPIFLFVSIAIKLDSKGPIFYSQVRVGQDGKLFKMYKFRSMVVGAENLLEDLKERNEMSGPMFKMKEDPRITKVGKLIRKTSIDELPQLINILKGDMSIVGPRPNLPSEVEQFTDYQMQKLLAKPGLTCFWQILGRNNIDFEQWIELDIKYIKERSFWLDVKLVLKTIPVLFGDKNAS